jgi:hypothetical protein
LPSSKGPAKSADHPIDIDVGGDGDALNRAPEALRIIQPSSRVRPPPSTAGIPLQFAAAQATPMAAHVHWAERTLRAEALFGSTQQQRHISVAP